jgi:hypothetical protein
MKACYTGTEDLDDIPIQVPRKCNELGGGIKDAPAKSIHELKGSIVDYYTGDIVQNCYDLDGDHTHCPSQ